MSDINAYANDLLLDFADAMHIEMTRILKAEFGNGWLRLGVRKHFKEDQFNRVERLLANPMRVVCMERSEEEVHGLEHFWNIFNGNWNIVFGELLKDKQRTEVFLGEITELRHNLAHRRGRHILLRRDLVRILGNCRSLLSAVGSNYAEKFGAIADTLSSGGSPWGPVLAGQLPPSDEIYADFVGRPSELKMLSEWLAGSSPQILVWGYGGAGKSALAHKFARDVRDGSNQNLIAACWVSAKRTEYVEGVVRDRPADFGDTETFIQALWSSLYGDDDSQETRDPNRLIGELKEMPILLIVDDFDTVLEDERLSEFLLHNLRDTPTRVIYTSRQRVPGIKNLEVPPFSDEELRDFVSRIAVEYDANKGQCLSRITGIKSVTSGYPLFVSDLIHHAALVGIDNAMRDWSQKKGDAAREYALRRQIEHLGQASGDVLIALSVANRALIPAEISDITGFTDADSEAGLRALLQWRMVNQVVADESSSPAYRMNSNTSRLVQQTFREDGRSKTYAVAFKSLTGQRVPEAKKKAIGKVIYYTKEIERKEGFEPALEYLTSGMTGELADSPDLYGVLGWLYSRQSLEEFESRAQKAFNRSHQLGSLKTDTYFHWALMEKNIAEWMINNAQDGEITNAAIAEQWRKCEKIAEMGMQRCGVSQLLCYWAGYAACRDAKAMERAQNFSYAEGAYTRSIDWYNKALTAPVSSDVGPVNKGAIYRGLTLAFEGLGDEDQLRRSLLNWLDFSESDPYLETELFRLSSRFPSLRSVPEFVRLMQQSRVYVV